MIQYISDIRCIKKKLNKISPDVTDVEGNNANIHPVLKFQGVNPFDWKYPIFNPFLGRLIRILPRQLSEWKWRKERASFLICI